MNPSFTCILLLLSLSGTLNKYVHVDKVWYWGQSLSYCRQYYTDLAPVNNQRDIAELQKLTNYTGYKLIGMQRSSADQIKWMWSGGVEVSRFFWASGEPRNETDRIYGGISKDGWHSVYNYPRTFFCYRAIVVEEIKTWEEALEYCREHHDDLASVASATEMMLMQRELRKHNTTEPVWIGLRFLSGDWLWVDGQEMNYEAWGEGEKPLCPLPKMKCGTLLVTGGSLSVWEAHDCEERHNFICY